MWQFQCRIFPRLLNSTSLVNPRFIGKNHIHTFVSASFDCDGIIMTYHYVHYLGKYDSFPLFYILRFSSSQTWSVKSLKLEVRGLCYFQS
jgi:hypothetical protein